MKKLACLVLVLSSGLLSLHLHGQEEETTKLETNKPVKEPFWFVGLGWNIVDDDGSELATIGDVFDNWNFVPYPSRLNAGREFKNGLGIQWVATYNRYTEGTIVDRVPVAEDTEYHAMDIFLTYDLNGAIGHTGIFDPYIGLGGGYACVSDLHTPTANTLLGLRIWLGEKWAIDLNSVAKFSTEAESTNHLQHSFGLLYKFKPRKARKDEAMAAEPEVAGVVYRAGDPVGSRIPEMGLRSPAVFPPLPMRRIYFDFDSNELSTDSRLELEKLIDYLEANRRVRLLLESHADTRGSEAYNQMLSERRLKSVMTFLMARGMLVDGWETRALGESAPLIPCEKDTDCSEEEHARNRRVELRLRN